MNEYQTLRSHTYSVFPPPSNFSTLSLLAFACRTNPTLDWFVLSLFPHYPGFDKACANRQNVHGSQVDFEPEALQPQCHCKGRFWTELHKIYLPLSFSMLVFLSPSLWLSIYLFVSIIVQTYLFLYNICLSFSHSPSVWLSFFLSISIHLNAKVYLSYSTYTSYPDFLIFMPPLLSSK